MCTIGLLCVCICNVRTRSLSLTQSMRGHEHMLCRKWLSCHTSLRAAVNQQSLLRLLRNLAAAHATLADQKAAAAGRAAPAWEHVQRLQRRRRRSWLRAGAARSSSLCNCLAPRCRAALRQGDMQRHGRRLPCYQSVPAVWPVRAVVRNRHVPRHIRLCANIVQTRVSNEGQCTHY